ncbi:sensor histidine kinase [Phnomibacter ginsenosidimutans]|uniref:Sensor histidine kinase n=1 Tax=Phnomibacter ginsenosidimutans TaxID=2676868 RepID=A0A6I6GQF5_9BACT|nr:histidine kinase [Phnomibacter ginsenosidimutans]QGW29172.1 sensor histidine kinase [Phnomibacter ginsenosidimutans]
MFKRKLPYYWIAQFGGWGFYVLLYTFYYYTISAYYSDYAYYFQNMFTEAGTGFLISHLMRTVIKETKLLTLSLAKQIGWMVVTTLIFGFIYSSVVVVIEEKMGWEPEYYIGATFAYKLARMAVGGALFFTIWSLLYLMYHYVVSTQRQRINQVKLEAVVKDLELKTIKAHINPHFIFNALNSIRALIDENPDRARTAVTELSQLLRSSMNADKEELVSLERELKIVNNYLALEQIRFEDRLRVQLDIDPDTLKQKVPPMMLQTLVENAIKHGISKEMHGGEVFIGSDFVADHHELVVRNTGHLVSTDSEEGFGISSTTNRLQLLFGNKASFNIQNVAGHTVEAKIIMPVTVN